MDFILFGKTILVVNKKFGLVLANQLRKRKTNRTYFSGDWDVHGGYGILDFEKPMAT